MGMQDILLYAIQIAIERLTKIKQNKKIDLIYATVILDRSCGLLRDYLMYYDLARRGDDFESVMLFKSYSGWRDALKHLKGLYRVFNDVRSRAPELLADPYYDIERQWKPVLNRWIEDHNKGVPSKDLEVGLLS